ncbi:hypothetical protein [Dyadobacter sediminis]|uniref:EVE domain-containing protein n=1 Tax=Dyadobacter sediminis TaxID=1493691 RepID=A0A5R9K6A8_9BACT|nr:hypothetical protein [Dyadobacter sediminis]TLU89318.1 hypothetical protein FEM55_21445 [Dyadobacter sediminis]GGC06486.1 hypothetical protein GCM10011325_36660 [Dyadobacter sediminis]
MAYYVTIFSPDTYNLFTSSERSISGFRESQKSQASVIKKGDKLIAYVTKLSRWVGVLEVTGDYFISNTPVYSLEDDVYTLRFPIKEIVWLPLDQSLPIDNDDCWNNLSFTKSLPKKSSAWTNMVRGNLRRFEEVDGAWIETYLINQIVNPTVFGLSDTDKKKLASMTVKTQDSKEVEVSVPTKEEHENSTDSHKDDIRESIKVQAMLAKIGERMNLKIWLPKSDRQRVLAVWKPESGSLLEALPLNYDDTTLKTIENIDVLWVKGRSIVRAFEVEHTTSIYSGILRMADLMALQPNLDIRAHIVAPTNRKSKVMQEISRPVFALLEKGPLSESCTFISYEAVEELAKEKRLEYMTDKVLDEFQEYAAESER